MVIVGNLIFKSARHLSALSQDTEATSFISFAHGRVGVAVEMENDEDGEGPT